MRSRRFIPMVDGLSLRIAPSGALGGATSAVVSSPSDTSGDPGGPGNSPMDLTIPDDTPFTCAIPVDPTDPYAWD